MTTTVLGYMADPTAEARAEQRRRENKEKAAYFLRQRVLGVFMLLTGIAAPFVTSEGITASLFCIPYGLAMIVSKERMVTEN